MHGSNVTEDRYYYYDGQQRLCRYRTREGGDTVYQYDAAGQLTGYQKGLSNGTTCSAPTGTAKVSLTYDDLGRVTLTNYADSNTPDISRTYDLDSNLLTLNRAGVNWTYAYDTLSQLTSEALSIDGRSYSLSYIYNGDGYLTRRTLPTGRQVNYTYDALGRQATVKDGSSNLATSITYHPDGQAAGLTYGNGQIYTKTINNLMQPTRVWSQKGGTKAFDRSYQYDNRGLVTNLTDSVNGAYSQSYTYDGLRQLKTASGIWGTGSFTYDSLGNIRSKTLGTRNVVMSYASNNRLTSYTDSGSGPNKSLSYDSRGNVTALGSLNFVYDYADQPKSVSGTASGSYAYDGNFKRVKNTVGGSTIYTVYDASGSLAHIDDLGAGDETDYVSGAGMGLARIKNNAVTYLHNDHLRSAASGSNSSGSVLWTQHYLSFGEQWNDVAANDDQAGFTGHIHDKVTGLNYMQARYYDPTIGRFLSIDPVTFDGLNDPSMFNRFAYAANNPIMMIDPDGRNPKSYLIKRTKTQLVRVREFLDRKHAIRSRQRGDDIEVVGSGAKSEAKAIEKAAAENPNDVMRHKGHDLSDGSTGKPHFQTDGQSGHSFWSVTSSVVGAAIVGLEVVDEIDPFKITEMGCADLDCDGNGIDDHLEDPDWVDPWPDDEDGEPEL